MHDLIVCDADRENCTLFVALSLHPSEYTVEQFSVTRFGSHRARPDHEVMKRVPRQPAKKKQRHLDSSEDETPTKDITKEISSLPCSSSRILTTPRTSRAAVLKQKYLGDFNDCREGEGVAVLTISSDDDNVGMSDGMGMANERDGDKREVMKKPARGRPRTSISPEEQRLLDKEMSECSPEEQRMRKNVLSKIRKWRMREKPEKKLQDAAYSRSYGRSDGPNYERILARQRVNSRLRYDRIREDEKARKIQMRLKRPEGQDARHAQHHLDLKRDIKEFGATRTKQKHNYLLLLYPLNGGIDSLEQFISSIRYVGESLHVVRPFEHLKEALCPTSRQYKKTISMNHQLSLGREYLILQDRYVTHETALRREYAIISYLGLKQLDNHLRGNAYYEWTEELQSEALDTLTRLYELNLERLNTMKRVSKGHIESFKGIKNAWKQAFGVDDFGFVKLDEDRLDEDEEEEPEQFDCSPMNDEEVIRGSEESSEEEEFEAEDNSSTAHNAEKIDLTKVNAELEVEIRKLNSQVESLKKKLEVETLLRTGTQSTLDAALKDLRLQKLNLKTQLGEETKKRHVEMTTVSRRIENEYEEKLAATLETRKKTIENITRNKDDLKHQLDHVKNLQNESTEREKEMRIRMREVESESGSYETRADLQKKIAEMDKRLADEQSLRRSLLDDKDRQLEMYQRRVKDLNDEITRLMAECKELADAKVLLDSELRDYESLLMSEESRLNLSQRSSPQVTRTEEFRSPSGDKRRRLSDMERSNLSGGVRYSHCKANIESSHKTPVKIVEAAENGEYIKLENECVQDINRLKIRLIATTRIRGSYRVDQSIQIVN